MDAWSHHHPISPSHKVIHSISGVWNSIFRKSTLGTEGMDGVALGSQNLNERTYIHALWNLGASSGFVLMGLRAWLWSATTWLNSGSINTSCCPRESEIGLIRALARRAAAAINNLIHGKYHNSLCIQHVPCVCGYLSCWHYFYY